LVGLVRGDAPMLVRFGTVRRVRLTLAVGMGLAMWKLHDEAERHELRGKVDRELLVLDKRFARFAQRTPAEVLNVDLFEDQSVRHRRAP
jgi:hypothetical protein